MTTVTPNQDEPQMISFGQQFRLCKKEGAVGAGPSRYLGTDAVSGRILEGKPSLCLRFGGDCNSGNFKCRQLRVDAAANK